MVCMAESSLQQKDQITISIGTRLRAGSPYLMFTPMTVIKQLLESYQTENVILQGHGYGDLVARLLKVKYVSHAKYFLFCELNLQHMTVSPWSNRSPGR